MLFLCPYILTENWIIDIWSKQSTICFSFWGEIETKKMQTSVKIPQKSIINEQIAAFFLRQHIHIDINILQCVQCVWPIVQKASCNLQRGTSFLL